MDYCARCMAPREGVTLGLCPACRGELGVGVLIVHIADEFAACDNCGAAIDGPGFCPRCQRDLDDELEEMTGR